MVCIIKNKNKINKRLFMDIWDQDQLNLRISKAFIFRSRMADSAEKRRRYYKREFIFSFKKQPLFHRKPKYTKKYISPRLLFAYYLLMRRRHFIKFADKAKRKHGYFFKNYIAMIEGRLFMLIYRSGFSSNIFKLKNIIDRGIFLVNTVKRYYANYIVKIGDLIQVDFKYKQLLQDDLYYRLKYFYKLPKLAYRYMFINYKFMFIFFLRAPEADEIKYPLKLDIYIGSTVYFLS